jgi:hypothetical protein
LQIIQFVGGEALRRLPVCFQLEFSEEFVLPKSLLKRTVSPANDIYACCPLLDLVIAGHYFIA